VTTDTDPVALTDQLTAAIGEDPGLALDLSANRTVLELSGPNAREVLEKGCPADLHSRTFGPGSAVSTTLSRVPVLLWQTGEDEYRLLPRASFADYVARWLLDAMVEFTG
jgi:sarcosine oxidase subunit gamma